MSELRILVGLGNPGKKYQYTRHNAGFFVLDELAKRHDLHFKEQKAASVAHWGQVTLLKPQTYMNLSGTAVQAQMAKKRLPPQALLLIQDDIDLPLGRLRLKHGGGSGGQRGIQDIINRIGDDFFRLKIGVGRPPKGWTVPRWVLTSFPEEEQALLSSVVKAAADGVEDLLEQSTAKVMSRLNGLDLSKPQQVRYQLKPFDGQSRYLEDISQAYATLWDADQQASLAFLQGYASYPGFRGFVALLAGNVVGFGFGHRLFPGNWWTERVKDSLGKDQEVLNEAWVLVELAVLPEHRLKGLGKKLHNALLGTQPCQRALLSTPVDNKALDFYDRLGWRRLQHVVLSESSQPFVLMTKEK